MDYRLNPQWALNETADHFLKIGKDLIRVATSDSVQPIALLACEKFGATIAICPQTRNKIERLIKSQNSNVLVGFLKAKVGFSNDGSIVHLSRSLAGVNFLALASALVSTTDTHEAGMALENMIMASATDKTLAPTAFHLKGLLDVLEPRLNGAGFLNDVLWWKEWWMRSVGSFEPDRLNLRDFGERFPNPEGLQKITAALRDVCRVGEAKRVTFTAKCGAPWLTAFVIWCLGISPEIQGPQGQVFLLGPTSQVTIIYSGQPEFHEDIQIEIVSMFNSFIDMMSVSLAHPEGDKPHLALGMVDIQTYAKHHLIRLGIDSGLPYRALLQALPYALERARDPCMLRGDLDKASQDSSSLVTSGNPFPLETTIANVMAKYLSLSEPVKLKKLDEDTRIVDLPLVRLLLKQENDGCIALSEWFYNRLCQVAADILALSLFDGCLDFMLLCYNVRFDPSDVHEFVRNLRGIYIEGFTDRFNFRIILLHALKLLHHNVTTDIRDGTWIGSSFKGQVVFPKLFEEQSIRKDGYLELFCLRGTLALREHGDRPISIARSNGVMTPAAFNMDLRDTPVTPSFKLFTDEELLWQVQISIDCLLVSMGWSKSGLKANPFWMLEALVGSMFVDSCPHPPDSSLDRSLLGCKYVIPMILAHGTSRESNQGSIGIIPVGTNGMCILALSMLRCVGYRPTSARFVIGRGTCLNCLLDQARLTECKYIIY